MADQLDPTPQPQSFTGSVPVQPPSMLGSLGSGLNNLSSMWSAGQQDYRAQHPYSPELSAGQNISNEATQQGGWEQMLSQVPNFGPADIGGMGAVKLLPMGEGPAGASASWWIHDAGSNQRLASLLTSRNPNSSDLWVDVLEGAGPNTVGPHNIRSLTEELVRAHPGIKKIWAYRVSGAKGDNPISQPTSVDVSALSQKIHGPDVFKNTIDAPPRRSFTDVARREQQQQQRIPQTLRQLRSSQPDAINRLLEWIANPQRRGGT